MRNLSKFQDGQDWSEVECLSVKELWGPWLSKPREQTKHVQCYIFTFVIKWQHKLYLLRLFDFCHEQIIHYRRPHIDENKYRHTNNTVDSPLLHFSQVILFFSPRKWFVIKYKSIVKLTYKQLHQMEYCCQGVGL